MVEQGYNYLDGPIHSIAEFFETRIKNLDKLIPPSVTSRIRKKRKKGSKKRKLITFYDSDDEDSYQPHSVKQFCQYHGACGHTTDQCTPLKILVKQAKQKNIKQFHKMKRSVNIMVQKQVKKVLKQKKRKHTETLNVFEKMSVSNSDQESFNSSSSEEGKV